MIDTETTEAASEFVAAPDSQWGDVATVAPLYIRGGIVLARRSAGPSASAKEIEDAVAGAFLYSIRVTFNAGGDLCSRFIAAVSAAAAKLAPPGWQHDGQMQGWEAQDLRGMEYYRALSEEVISNGRAFGVLPGIIEEGAGRGMVRLLLQRLGLTRAA